MKRRGGEPWQRQRRTRFVLTDGRSHTFRLHLGEIFLSRRRTQRLIGLGRKRHPIFCHFLLYFFFLLCFLLLLLYFLLHCPSSRLRLSLHLPLRLSFSLVVLPEADVPGQAADGRHRLELVDHVARYEVHVVVTQADAGVTDALPPQLVEFGVVHPLHAL